MAELAVPQPQPTYALTRFVVLRLLGFVYLVAFAVFLRQGLSLIGHDGLLPADQFLREGADALGGRGAGFWKLPTLFWLADSDRALTLVGWAGALLSALVVAGYGNAIVFALLWALYMSVVHAGQLFWGYGWEIQLLETGFLAIFLAPALSLRPFAGPAPRQVVWLFWWLAFRIYLGAGLIKLRGDECWRDLTCLDFHYQTQPNPNPLSPFFHFLPHPVHAAGVLFNHVVEVLCPFALFAGRRVRHAAAALMALFQVLLIVSGNLSFLNWLTLVPVLACFDDGLLARFLPARVVSHARAAAAAEPSRAWEIASWSVLGLIGLLSVAPVGNLLSPNQRMNTGFNALDLVNTYGAFGSVGKERGELIVEGTRDAVPDERARWVPYAFYCKPGDPLRRPCVITPYQLRIDWQMWFAAMSAPDDEPWLIHLVWKLLHNDPGALSLLDGNPFPGAPPKFIRIRYAKFEFAPMRGPAWWKVTDMGVWLPPLSADEPRLQEIVRAEGWSDAPP